MALSATAALAAFAIVQATTPDLQLFGRGALHWHARGDEIVRALPRWGPATCADHFDTLIVPGRVAYIRAGRCAFPASLQGPIRVTSLTGSNGSLMVDLTTRDDRAIMVH